MRRLAFLPLALSVAFCSVCWAQAEGDSIPPGSCRVEFGPQRDGVQVVTILWVTGDTGGLTATLPPGMTGEIQRVVIKRPGAPASGSLDLILEDVDGADLFAGAGMNRGTTSTEHFVPLLGNGTGASGLGAAGGYSRVTWVSGETTLRIALGPSHAAGLLRIYVKQL